MASGVSLGGDLKLLLGGAEGLTVNFTAMGSEYVNNGVAAGQFIKVTTFKQWCVVLDELRHNQHGRVIAGVLEQVERKYAMVPSGSPTNIASSCDLSSAAFL